MSENKDGTENLGALHGSSACDWDSSQQVINVLSSVKFRFWTCPTCVQPRITWTGGKATCESCGRSNDESVCKCGNPSSVNTITGKPIGCCDECLPF